MEVPLQIKSPKTGRMITVGKGEYNKLLKKYTENDLLSLSTTALIPITLPQNVIYTIIIHSEIDDIINLYHVSKLYKKVLDKPYVLIELSLIYLKDFAFSFNDFLKLYFN